MLQLILALFPAVCSALTLHLDKTEGFEDVRARMLASPDDAAVQAGGCLASAVFIFANPDAYLTHENVMVFTTAIRNHIEEENVVDLCFKALGSFSVTFNRSRTLALNNGTDVAEVLNLALRTHANNHKFQLDNILNVASFATYVACDVQAAYREAGCLDRVWDAFDQFTGAENSDIKMSCFQAFSDHSGCDESANAIANKGGMNVGAKKILDLTKGVVGSDFHPTAMHGGSVINLQYEAATVANGLLDHGDEDRLDLYVREKYHETLLAMMRSQPSERSTNERTCAGLFFMADNKPSLLPGLMEGGALELVAAAMEKFKGEDNVVFVTSKMSTMYPVLPSCNAFLVTMVNGLPESKERLLQLGVLNTYETMRPDLQKLPDMKTLPAMLTLD